MPRTITRLILLGVVALLAVPVTAAASVPAPQLPDDVPIDLPDEDLPVDLPDEDDLPDDLPGDEEPSPDQSGSPSGTPTATPTVLPTTSPSELPTALPTEVPTELPDRGPRDPRACLRGLDPLPQTDFCRRGHVCRTSLPGGPDGSRKPPHESRQATYRAGEDGSRCEVEVEQADEAARPLHRRDQ